MEDTVEIPAQPQIGSELPEYYSELLEFSPSIAFLAAAAGYQEDDIKSLEIKLANTKIKFPSVSPKDFIPDIAMAGFMNLAIPYFADKGMQQYNWHGDKSLLEYTAKGYIWALGLFAGSRVQSIAMNLVDRIGKDTEESPVIEQIGNFQEEIYHPLIRAATLNLFPESGIQMDHEGSSETIPENTKKAKLLINALDTWNSSTLIPEQRSKIDVILGKLNVPGVNNLKSAMLLAIKNILPLASWLTASAQITDQTNIAATSLYALSAQVRSYHTDKALYSNYRDYEEYTHPGGKLSQELLTSIEDTIKSCLLTSTANGQSSLTVDNTNQAELETINTKIKQNLNPQPDKPLNEKKTSLISQAITKTKDILRIEELRRRLSQATH